MKIALSEIEASSQHDTNIEEVLAVIERSFRAADPAEFLSTIQSGLVWLSRTAVLQGLQYPDVCADH